MLKLLWENTVAHVFYQHSIRQYQNMWQWIVQFWSIKSGLLLTHLINVFGTPQIPPQQSFEEFIGVSAKLSYIQQKSFAELES